MATSRSSPANQPPPLGDYDLLAQDRLLARLDRAVAELKDELGDPEDAELRARNLVERLALTLQGSLLVRHGDPAVADAFCASRLDGLREVFGSLPRGLELAAIVEWHRPQLPAG